MNPNNLYRTEATERKRLLAVSEYWIHLILGLAERAFDSTTTLRFSCTQPGASTFIELTADSVERVELNGVTLDPAVVFNGNRIQLDDLQANNELHVQATCVYSRTGEGLHRFVDPVDKEAYLYSQFEAYDAHRVFACFDQPDLKARFTFTVEAPAHWKVISNGAAVERPSAAEGRGLWKFATTEVMSTYITALIAGPYFEIRKTHDGIDLGWFCRESLAQHLDSDELFEVTQQGFDFYHRVFDYRYPFGKYDQLMVPEFNAGAMENAGAVTYLEDYIFRSKVTDARYERRGETILHEMAHMWFGDLVTMGWWDDLWLNESFATYASVLCQSEATRWSNAWTTFCNAEKTWAYRQDQLPSTHPVSADAPDIDTVKTNFDGITYAKGASILKQLVAWVGQEEFLAGLRIYFRRFEWGNTTLADLLACLTEASGRDLSNWSGEWLETTGVNTLRPQFTLDADGRYNSFSVLQEAVPDHPTLRSHRIAIGLYDLVDDRLERRDRIELDISGASTDVAKIVGVSQPDLILLNDDDLTFAKIRLDPRSIATVVEHIGAFTDSLPRTLCWAAAWDMTRDGEMTTKDFLTLVLHGIAAETDIGVVQATLQRAALAIQQFGLPELAAARTAALAAKMRELTMAAPPCSDHQLAFALAFVSSATSHEDTGLIKGLLDGTQSIEGLAIDADLRWTLLTRLVILGLAGDAEIEAEAQRDATALGEKRSAAARTARPTAAAKAEAWAAVIDSDTLSNHIGIATMSTFWLPEQRDLLEPYVDRYFAALGALWRDRNGEVAERVTEMLYPAMLVSPEIVAKTDDYLASETMEPPLRRALMEARDGVARALRARAVDAP